MIPKIPSRPLERIALSCSGGGYRAASFHLGAMGYLNRIQFRGNPLLENVKLISTVSGGTFTGAVYALQMQEEGKTFKEIYDFILKQLASIDLIKLSVKKMAPNGKLKNPNKRKNLINAFSELYDDYFTAGATFKAFDNMNSHLEAVVFNSTEFNNGINFRFRNRGTGLFGNKYMPIEQDMAQEVKVADAIASSACFPGGFEPMLWPDDFVHDNSPLLSKLCSSLQDARVTGSGIMDGGIYDNQGIQSILLYKKKQDPNFFDLIIISDVASPYMKPFKPLPNQKKEGKRKLTLNAVKKKYFTINRIINVSMWTLAILFLGLPFIWDYSASFKTGLCVGLTLAPLSVLLFKKIVLSRVEPAVVWVRNAIIDLIPPFMVPKLAALRIEDLSIHRLEPLLVDRVRSLAILFMDVFLKVVRRLNYADLYDDPKFTFRRMSNLINELTEVDFSKGKSRAKTEDSKNYKAKSLLINGDYNTVIGPKIKAVAEEASSFGTNLWFTDDDKIDDTLNKLVATGEFTMCFNLIDYLELLILVEDNGFNELDAATQMELEKIYAECLNDWNRFKEDPMFMVKEMAG